MTTPVAEFLAPKPSLRNGLIFIALCLIGLLLIEWLIPNEPVFTEALRSGCYGGIGATLFSLAFPSLNRHKGAITLYRDRLVGPAGENREMTWNLNYGNNTLALTDINLKANKPRTSIERLCGDYRLHDNLGNSICISGGVFGRQGAREVFQQLTARIHDWQWDHRES